MGRTLYWKRLVIVGAALLAFGGAVFAVHRVQIKSQVIVYKEAAERAEAGINGDAAKRGEVIELYAKYLKFRPRDEAAYQKYATLLFEQAKNDPEPAAVARATLGVEAFLRAFPAHPDERRQLAEVYAKTNKFNNARQHIDMLFTAPGGAYKSDIEVLELAATCEVGLGNLPKALEHLNAAMKTGKAPVRVYKRALELNYANVGDAQRNANIAGLLETLLRDERFKNDLAARVAAGQFQRFLNEMQNARDNITYALTQIPGGADDPDALLAIAEIEVAEIRTLDQIPEQLKKAEAHLRKAYARDPKNTGVGALLAEVLTRQDKRPEGIEVLRNTAKLLTKMDSDYALVVDRLLDLGEQTDSAVMIEALATDANRKTLVAYFRGRLALLKSDWPAALQLLEEAGPNVARVPTFHKKAMVGLARCYATVQNVDKQLDYCMKALNDDPEYPLAMVGAAEALAKMGRVEDARRWYRLLVNKFQLIDYRADLARLELLDVLVQSLEADLRNWTRFEESLGPVAARTPELHILHADSLVARGKPGEAVKVLRGWLDQNPKHPKAGTVFVALSRLSTGGSAESALAVLDEAKTKVGDSVDIRLARSALLVARTAVPTPAEFDALGAGAENFPKGDRFKLWFGLGQAAGRVADLQPEGEPAKELRAAALKYLRTAADLMPKDLLCRTVLLDYALAAGDTGTVARALKEIADVEGKGGPFATLGQIAIKLPEVRKMTDAAQRAAAVKELRELARVVRAARPGWGRVFVALAELDAIEGLNDAALANYTEAIEKGERQEVVIRRAVDLYRLKKQDDKAIGLLNKLRTEVRLPDDLERYRAIRDLLTAPELPKNSRPTVDNIAPAGSTDHRMQLLRGALLATIGAEADSLVAFRRAVELNGQSPETWGSLVAQLVRVNKFEDAKRAVVQAQKALTAAPPATTEAKVELKLGLGGLHEMIGELKVAQEFYREAIAAAPLELNPTRQLVLFFQRNGPLAAAEELLRKATESPAPEVARWARRHLATTLVSRANAYNARHEALALIERNLAVAANDAEDVKARAVIWTVDPVTREKGIEVLKSYGDRGDLTPDEYYLLGRLSFDQGTSKFPDAEKYFKFAARIRPGVTAEHLAALVRVYVALNRLDLADAALERLKINNPNSWEAVREETRVLHRRSKDKFAAGEPEPARKVLDEARLVIQKFPGWDTGDTIVYRTGPLFEEIGLTIDAEALYRKYLDTSTDPGAHQALAILFIRMKLPEKAIKLAFEREAAAPVLLSARLLTGAVRAKRPDAATEAKIETWLDAALIKSSGDSELEAALIGAKAELFDARGDYANAIKEYERSVAAFDRVRVPKGTKDVVVNNLCMLLVLHQPARANDAVKMMSDLIAIRGPVPAFLDTRAVAYLVSSRPDEAIRDLELALIQYDRAVYHFHLAWAFDLNVLEAKRVYAADELKKARGLKLTADDLHPIEFEKYKALLGKYKLPVE